jgi:hypothetical protein
MFRALNVPQDPDRDGCASRARRTSCRVRASRGTASSGCSTSSAGWTSGCREDELDLRAIGEDRCDELIGAGLLLMRRALPLGWKARLDDPAAKSTPRFDRRREGRRHASRPGRSPGSTTSRVTRPRRTTKSAPSFSQLKPSEHNGGVRPFISGQDLDKDTQRTSIS